MKRTIKVRWHTFEWFEYEFEIEVADDEESDLHELAMNAIIGIDELHFDPTMYERDVDGVEEVEDEEVQA